MKNIDQIQFEIDRLEKLNNDLEEQAEVTLNYVKKQLLKINISQNKIRIKALKWVLEG